MPSKTITVLGVSSIVLLVGYIACVATAIFFATLRTELTAHVREVETRVGSLETKYYAAIAKVNEIDVVSRGFVAPETVEYIALDGTPTLTRADR